MQTTPASKRHLLAILAADLVGYSALMARDEQAAFEVIQRLRRELLEPRIEQFGGEVIKRMGDGWLASFTSVTAAASCALEVQRALEAEHEIQLRMGLHLGEVILEDDEFYGEDLIRISSKQLVISDYTNPKPKEP